MSRSNKHDIPTPQWGGPEKSRDTATPPPPRVWKMRIKIFAAHQYESVEEWEQAINDFLLPLQTKVPNEVTILSECVFINYGVEIVDLEMGMPS